jgi:hypothetical protein
MYPTPNIAAKRQEATVTMPAWCLGRTKRLRLRFRISPHGLQIEAFEIVRFFRGIGGMLDLFARYGTGGYVPPEEVRALLVPADAGRVCPGAVMAFDIACRDALRVMGYDR